MSKDKIEKHYKIRSRGIVDTLFDSGYFSEVIKRKDMRAVEELLAFYFQSEVESALKGKELLRKIREKIFRRMGNYK